MSTEAEIPSEVSIPERPQTNEEKVLAFIADRPDGCSSFAIAIETKIQRSAVEFILEKLQHVGKVQSTRNGKGVITWYSAGKAEPKIPNPKRETEPELPKPAPIVKEDEDGRVECPVEGCGTRILADRQHMGSHFNIVHGNLPPRDRSELLDKILPREEGPSLEDLKAEMETEAKEAPNQESGACRYCGKVMEAGKCRQHEPVCGSNPNRNSRKAREVKKCRHCGKPVEKYLWQHEQFCTKNPDPKRKVPKVFEKAEASETAASLLESVVNDRPSPEPLPIDETVPPGSELKPWEREPTEEERKESELETTRYAADLRAEFDRKQAEKDLAAMPACESGSCLIQADPVLDAPFSDKPSYRIPVAVVVNDPAPFGYTGRMINELPPMVTTSEPRHVSTTLPPATVRLRKDPLEELVRTHRVRVGREISKLKKVERKLRRRAAAAESMADRVKAARRTKEKELERFEREVAAVKGVSP